MVNILQKENKILRETARLVPITKIKTSEIQKVIDEMKTAIKGEEDAVAIAAPQIGKSFRIFVVSGNILLSPQKRIREKKADAAAKKTPVLPDLVFINPEIIKQSKKEQEEDEGCLSVRWWYGKVRRAGKTTVKAFDENGKSFTRGASGLLAQVFQHEIDHLNGVLFTDKARELREVPPQEKVAK